MRNDAHDPDDRGAVDERIDALARERGSELRRPAPARGLAHVHAARRRRQIVRAAGGAGLVALVAIGVNALTTDSDGRVGPVDSVAETSPPGTSEPTRTSAPSTSAPSTSAPASTPAPTSTTPVIDDEPNAAGAPDALYWTTGLNFAPDDVQTIIDPVTGAEARTEPVDSDASFRAQTEQTARFVLRPTIEDTIGSLFTYRLETTGIEYRFSVRASDAPPLAESDPDELARFDRCGQSELAVEGAATSALPARVRYVVLSLDRQRLVTIGGDCPADGTLVGQTRFVEMAERVEIFDAAHPDVPGRTLFTSSDSVGSIFFSPDGRYVAVEAEPGYRVFDVESGSEVAIAPRGCRFLGGRYARFDGPWAGDSSLVLSANCPGQPAALLVTNVATGDQVRVPVPADAGFPANSTTDGPFLTVEVDVDHFDRPTNAWFTICASTPDRTTCWYGQPGTEPVEIPGAAEASFLPLGFSIGG